MKRAHRTNERGDTPQDGDLVNACPHCGLHNCCAMAGATTSAPASRRLDAASQVCEARTRSDPANAEFWHRLAGSLRKARAMI